MGKKASFEVYLKTFALCIAFFALGISISCLGPTLPTLAINLNTTVSSLSHLLPSRGCGYLTGALTSGFLYEKVDTPTLLFLALLFTALGNAAIPFIASLSVVAVVMATIGFSMGVLDTGGNVFLLELWKKDSGPYIHLIHFMFGLGAAVAPLFAEPFIQPTTNQDSMVSEDVSDSDGDIEFNHTQEAFKNRDDVASGFPYVAWAYIICASFTLFVSLLFAFIRLQYHQPKSDVQNKAGENKESTIDEEGTKFRVTMLALLFVLFCVYVGTEVAFGTFIYTFATTCTKPMDKQSASLLNTLYWVAVSAGRALAIFISLRLSAKNMMFINMLLSLSSAIVFVFYPYFALSAQWLLWVTTALFGLGCASIFPTGISWAELYITMTGKAASCLIVGGSIGEMLIPLLAGSLVEGDPMSLMYIIVVCTFLMLIIFSTLVAVSRTKGKRRNYHMNKKQENSQNEDVPLQL